MEPATANAFEIETLLEGPPVTTCFQCDRTLPISCTRWHGEHSDQGCLVALFPYCESCLRSCRRLKSSRR
jgi:hypothetical protein